MNNLQMNEWQVNGADGHVDTSETFGRRVATVYGPQKRKRAHLIAAAPDLLEALEWIAYEASQYADGAEDSHYLAREMANFEAKARAAIAKAKGEASE